MLIKEVAEGNLGKSSIFLLSVACALRDQVDRFFNLIILKYVFRSKKEGKILFRPIYQIVS